MYLVGNLYNLDYAAAVDDVNEADDVDEADDGVGDGDDDDDG